MANDASRLNNFDNLTYIEARNPKSLLEELQKIVKPASLIATGPNQGGIGFWAIVEILAEGQNKRKRAASRDKVQKTAGTKTENLNLEVNNGKSYS